MANHALETHALQPIRMRKVERQQVVALRAFGGVEGFELRDEPPPEPQAGEVRIRVQAASVQFTDILVRRGLYPGLHAEFPLVLGYDVVGEVDVVGDGVSGFQVGDRVAALTVTGSYARFRTLAARELVRVPRSVDAAEAVALVLSWTTAYQLLHRVAEVKPGQRILVLGAAGAVGQALVTLARRDDVRVFAATRPGHADLARSMGAIPVGDPRQLPRELVDDGFDAVFDGIGEDGFAPSWAAVKHGGVLCAFGFSDAVRRGGSTLQLAATLLRMRAWNAFGHAHAHFYSVTAMKKAHPEWYRADLQLLLDMLAAKAIRPRIAQRVGIGGVVGAHHRLEMGHVEGKLVLCP